MTQSYITSEPNINKTLPKIDYIVAMPEPQNHLFEITLTINNWSAATLDIKMPVWTPGSYLVREYARHIQNLRAISSDGINLPVNKIAKNHWQIANFNYNSINIQYQVFANELTVRTNHLDSTHGYFNPAALCFYLPEYPQTEITIEIQPPFPNWQISTPLLTIGHHKFIAPDFDTLVDSPFEIGTQKIYDFTCLNKPHQLVVWGENNLDIKKAIDDISKIIQTEAEIFEGLPYDRYLFLLHLTGSGGGGLEHKTCCSLIYPRFNFKDQEKYHRFLQLVAHEFFHLWNIKRIRPIALETFDYNQENYTTSLWFSEGTTSYYDLLIPQRSGIYSRQDFLNELSKEITRYLTTSGRLVQPLSESSFDAWIKLYRPDANSSNSQISYYLKGEMVTLLLDLLIRSTSHNQKSFDNVMLEMWKQFGQAENGFTEFQLRDVITEIAQVNLTTFFAEYVDGLTELPFNEYLAPFGLELVPVYDQQTPYTGMTVKTENGKEIVKNVVFNSPANLAGIDPGDELLAINNFKVTTEQLNDRLSNFPPNETINITLFHGDRLITTPLTLASPQPTKYQIKFMDILTPEQQENLQGWLK